MGRRLKRKLTNGKLADVLDERAWAIREVIPQNIFKQPANELTPAEYTDLIMVRVLESIAGELRAL